MNKTSIWFDCVLFFLLVFSTDDRSHSASTGNEKLNKPIAINPNSNNQSNEGPTPLNGDTKRPNVDFLTKNIERVRMASLKNKYDLLNPFDWFAYFCLFREIHKHDDRFVFMTTGPVYPYSSQRLNASENALEQMRTYLKQVWFNICFFKFWFLSNRIIIHHHVHLILIIDRELILPIQMRKLFSITIENFVHQ